MGKRRARVAGRSPAQSLQMHRDMRSMRQRQLDVQREVGRRRAQGNDAFVFNFDVRPGQKVAFRKRPVGGRHKAGRVVWSKVIRIDDGYYTSKRRGGPGAWLVVGAGQGRETQVHSSELLNVVKKRVRKPQPIAPPQRVPAPKPATPKQSPAKKAKAKTQAARRQLNPTPPTTRQGKRLLEALRRRK